MAASKPGELKDAFLYNCERWILGTMPPPEEMDNEDFVNSLCGLEKPANARERRGGF